MSHQDDLAQLVAGWAAARTTANTPRYHDLIRDKTNVLLGTQQQGRADGLFVFVKKPLTEITTGDVEHWRDHLSEVGLSDGTVYSRVSRVSSFYEWLRRKPAYFGLGNPAEDARPPAPRAYTTDKTRPLTSEDVETLLDVVRERANSDHRSALSAKRDYALLRFYFTTGKRRAEIINLRWRDIELTEDGVRIITTEPPTDVPGVRPALVAYLKASERWDTARGMPQMTPDSPLWLRHDRAAKGQQGVTSHGFVFMLKKYAKAAGLGAIHLNQARHTVAQRIGAEAETLEEAQRRLGHQSPSMTRAYLNTLRQQSEGDKTDG